MPWYRTRLTRGPGSQGSELLQELNRREEEVARAVVPLALQGDEDEAVGRQCEALLRHRRAQHVAAQALDSRTVVGPHRDARVQIEALEVRLARPARGDPGGVGLAAELIDAGAGARPERDPPLDRGAADAGQRGRFLGEWVDVGGVIDVESAAREETLDAPVDGGEQPRHLLVARGLGGVELEAPVFSLGEDAVQEEGVEVDVQLEAAPEALDHRHGAAPPVAHARVPRAAAIEPEHGAYGDAEHRAAERMIVRKKIAQAVRQGEHPLAQGNARQDLIDEVGGLLRHQPHSMMHGRP